MDSETIGRRQLPQIKKILVTVGDRSQHLRATNVSDFLVYTMPLPNKVQEWQTYHTKTLSLEPKTIDIYP